MNKSSYGRRDRLVKERGHDSYHSRAKLTDPTVCTECGAVYLKGRWVWAEAPEGASRSVCPACRRIADRFPVGHIEMKGGFFAGHRDEIIHLVQHVEQMEKAHHPMERIISIDEMPAGALVTTTGIHLARRIGSALSSAYCGDLKVYYLNAESCVKISWVR
jgi:NMD protein affecting ribosome stability and mRNA decay